MNKLIHSLDLDDFLDRFLSCFARQKPLALEGDYKQHFQIIKELENLQYKQPQNIASLQKALMHLLKQGVLSLSEIYEFVKMINYMHYLSLMHFEGRLGSWLERIEFRDEILHVCEYFDDKGELKSSIDERFESIEFSLRLIKENISSMFSQFFSNKKLDPYLVDRQVYYLNNQESLLVRGGFNHVIKASVIGRSANGFFYIVPESLNKLKQNQSDLIDKKELIIYEYCKKISAIFCKNRPFLAFLDREFDRFDHYNARVNFAKNHNLEFILPSKSKDIIIKDFSHPGLNKPKPISINFTDSILMITGVNAGGKTMLLKSILSTVFCAKYLIPLKIDSTHSQIGAFKEIIPIIEDTQNSKNDISTFAGRMSEFAKLFGKKDAIVGVDEIELGTDADEAASLFFVMLSNLMENGLKLVITTHHKRLASLLATKDKVELLAALYDEKNRLPKYEFLKGTIGKSYAFETALRYGIAPNVVEKARKVYGEDKEKLNELIQKNIDLELAMKAKLKKAQIEQDKAKKLTQKLQEDMQKQEEDFKKRFSTLQKDFDLAIDEAKKAAKAQDIKSIHQGLNKAHNAKKILNQIKQHEALSPQSFQIGDHVKYNSIKGKIIAIKKDEAIMQSDTGRLRIPLSELKKTTQTHVKNSTKINIQKPKTASATLDLHGLRADEAIEKMDKFISDSLILGLEEVLIYHGIGTGRLSRVVSEFLKEHPSVKSFEDSTPGQGGFGSKVVKF